jgi:hypothetical protein
MKVLIASILAISAVPALAGDPNADLVAPREATYIQQRIPVLPNSIMIDNFATQANINAATAPLGSISAGRFHTERGAAYRIRGGVMELMKLGFVSGCVAGAATVPMPEILLPTMLPSGAVAALMFACVAKLLIMALSGRTGTRCCM